tara:strand:+ start:515 stop:835 length:321 start_codon:yes stop_codon:yes gene_type:complete
LQYDIQEYQELRVTGSHGIGHETVEAEIAIGTDIGFRQNIVTGEYELVADLETWNMNVPVERFIDKLNQQYAKATINDFLDDKGFTISKESTTIDNEIQITASRWV